VLAPGGLMYFQYPSRPRDPVHSLVGRIQIVLARIRYLRQSPPPMYMNSMERSRVEALLKRYGGRILEVEPNQDAGPEYISLAYAVTK
jgi:hypothetical protein